MVQSNQPRREIKQIDTVVQTYKPVSQHASSVSKGVGVFSIPSINEIKCGGMYWSQ